MLVLPVLLTGACWFITPREAKAYALFPLVHLLTGLGSTAIEAVGESAIAAAYFWIMLFLMLFRTRRAISKLLFLAMCTAAFGLHEGACLLMPVLLSACALRWISAQRTSERIFLAVSAVLILFIVAYELRWMIYPRIPGEREAALRGIYTFGFVYFEGRWNISAITAVAGMAALAWLFAIDRKPGDISSDRFSRLIAAGFVLFALLISLLPWLIEEHVAPLAHALSRYNPLLVSVVLGSLAVAAVATKASTRWALPPSLAIILALAFAQTTADLAATTRWRAYVRDFGSRLADNTGLIAWNSTISTGNPDRDANWQAMSAGWVMPLLSIIFSPNGDVRAIIDYPPDAWRPFEPSRIEDLPKLRGVDYEVYRRALTQGDNAFARGARP
jgi:hypothetical protein